MARIPWEHGGTLVVAQILTIFVRKIKVSSGIFMHVAVMGQHFHSVLLKNCGFEYQKTQQNITVHKGFKPNYSFHEMGAMGVIELMG